MGHYWVNAIISPKYPEYSGIMDQVIPIQSARLRRRGWRDRGRTDAAQKKTSVTRKNTGTRIPTDQAM
jgi:hypothetical protein